MATKTQSQPAHATLQKVSAELGATPRNTAELANRSGFSPATTRRCLVVLADEGLAQKHDDGTWSAKPAPQPEAQPTKKAPAKKAAKATKAAKQSAPADEAPSPLTGLAAKLARWGWSDALARRDAEVYELLAASGPLTKDQLAAKLTGFSDWSVRRLATSSHKGATHGEPLIEAVGTGKARTWKVVG